MSSTVQASVGDVGLPITVVLTSWPSDLTGLTAEIVATPLDGVAATWDATTAVVGDTLEVTHVSAAGELSRESVVQLRVQFRNVGGVIVRDADPVLLKVVA